MAGGFTINSPFQLAVPRKMRACWSNDLLAPFQARPDFLWKSTEVRKTKFGTCRLEVDGLAIWRPRGL
jgi:hypothetical protein